MRKIVFTLVAIIFLSSSSIYSQGNWKWVNPSPQGNDIYTIDGTVSNGISMTGDCGTLVTTTNSGNNWTVTNKLNGISVKFLSYYQYDNNTIFIGTENGKILKSTNGGVNYFLCSQLSGSPVSMIQMIDLNKGFAIDFDKFYKTTNGGVNWTLITTAPHYFYSFACFSENNLLLMYRTEPGSTFYFLRYTSNGGANWTDTLFAGDLYRVINVEKPVNNTTTFIYHNGYVKKTTNTGQTWTTMNPANQISMSGICVVNENTIYGTGYLNNNFYLSTNSGVNWVQKSFPESIQLNMFKRIVFSNVSTGYVLGDNNKVYQTTNAGSNWNLITQNTTLSMMKDYAFIDNNTGYIAGNSNMILKTTNSGDTYTITEGPFTNKYLNSVCFINSNTGFAAGGILNTGLIARTTNSGGNWVVTCSLSTYSNYNKIRFFNQTTGLFSSQENNMYRTTNGGDDWVLVQSQNVKDIFEVCILNSSTGFVSGNMSNTEKAIYKTTDSGANWFQVYGGNGYWVGFYNMKFINQNTGYCIGYGMLKTTNGGNNWFQVNAPTTSFCTNIEIVNENIMYISGYGAVYKSTNAGYSWGQLDIPTNERIEFIKFFDANTGIIAGDNNIILRTTNGGGNFVSNINNNTNIPTGYSLGQNYPNPFNPMTNFKFSMLNAGDVKIVVYDVMGREVQTLVNERLGAGTYEVRFDALHGGSSSSLTSGVYFYRLITDGFTETKRMLMIK